MVVVAAEQLAAETTLEPKGVEGGRSAGTSRMERQRIRKASEGGSHMASSPGGIEDREKVDGTALRIGIRGPGAMDLAAMTVK